VPGGVQVFRLGRPISITYHHTKGGTYSHKFHAGARLLATPDGKNLIISGVSLKSFIEG
jgi:hypothetical protein